MHRSPFALAAIATMAVPGLDGQQVALLDDAPEGFDAALVIDAENRRWVVRAPANDVAGASLESETSFLRAVETSVDAGTLPFVVPRITKSVPLPEGGRAVVYPELPGRPLLIERLHPGPGIAASLGRAIAAIHELPVSVVENSGHVAYTAEDYRQRHLAEVDEAAQTGRVPVTLLRRWEQRLEDVSMWRFQPTVTHTSLSAETILVQAGNVSAVTEWSEVQVADPADDLSWLLTSAPSDTLDTIMEAYQLRRAELRDPYLTERALLSGELALIRWLLHGVRNSLPEVVEDAVAMLGDLDVETAAADGELVNLPRYGSHEPRVSDSVPTVALSTLQHREPESRGNPSQDADPLLAASSPDESSPANSSPAKSSTDASSPTEPSPAGVLPEDAASLPADVPPQDAPAHDSVVTEAIRYPADGT